MLCGCAQIAVDTKRIPGTSPSGSSCRPQIIRRGKKVLNRSTWEKNWYHGCLRKEAISSQKKNRNSIGSHPKNCMDKYYGTGTSSFSSSVFLPSAEIFYVLVDMGLFVTTCIKNHTDLLTLPVASTYDIIVRSVFIAISSPRDDLIRKYEKIVRLSSRSMKA